MASDRNDWMRRVQGLIDKANSTDSPAERDAFMAKADELMVRHAIEQFELEQNRPADQREKPVVATVVAAIGRGWRVNSLLDQIFYQLARHCGVRVGQDHVRASDHRAWKVVGYEADVDYLSMLYLSVQMTLVSKMEPSVDPNRSEVENYAALREAGVPVERIIQRLGYDYHLPGYEPKTDRWTGRVEYVRKTNRTVLGRFRRQYAKLCAERGVEPVKGATGEGYQLCFMQSFKEQLRTRLQEMQSTRDEVSTGHELVVAGRKEAVNETLWTEWPDMRPHPKGCDCEQCHFCGKADCKFEKCRYYAANKDKPIRASKVRELVYNPAGAAAGRAAADSVNLAKGSIEGGPKGAIE